MPIVNKANYVECPSCKRWMHAQRVDASTIEHGNRALICQECYERADGSNDTAMQKAMRDAVLAGVGMYKTEYVSPQQFDRGVIESSANSGAVGQAAAQGAQTKLSQRGNMHLSDAEYAEAVAAQTAQDARQTKEDQRKLAGQAKPHPVPVARAKLDMPTNEELDDAWSTFLSFGGGAKYSLKMSVVRFVERRNGKL